MKIKERLLECKIKLGIKSDYGLAKALKINRGTLSGYMTGKRAPDAFAAVKMAEVLKLHPLQLIAEFEAETEKNEEKRNFWVNFAQRIKIGTIGMLALISTAFWLPEQKATAAMLDTHNVYYVKCNIWEYLAGFASAVGSVVTLLHRTKPGIYLVGLFPLNNNIAAYYCLICELPPKNRLPRVT